MKLNLKNKTEALDILKTYNGANPYMIWLKNSIFVKKTMSLNDFNGEFILKNKDFEIIEYEKNVKIADWYGISLQEKLSIDFTPKILKITYIIGEMENFIVCYVFYRRSQKEAKMLFIPKKAILTELFPKKWNECQIDFDYYDNLSKNKAIKLKSHQKDGIKFMVTMKKCINADGMGAGKTIQAIIASLASGSKKILIVCPASLKTNWKNEILNYEDDENAVIVKNQKWKESKFTIMNYDILDNFYTVPEEIAYETVKDVDENNNIITRTQIKWKKKPKYDNNGNIIEEGIPKMKISRNAETIREAMDETQLFKSKFDCIIIDEAHKLCNNSSTRYKVIKDLLKRVNPNYVFMLTGTPITNRPMNYYNLLSLINHPVSKDYYYYIQRYCNGELLYLKGEKWKWSSVFLKKIGKTWKEVVSDSFLSQKLDDFLKKNAKYIWKPNGCSNLDELKELTKNVYIRRLTSDFGDMVKKHVIEKYYDFSDNQQKQYDKIWDEYKESQDLVKQEEIEKYKTIIEGTILRQFVANQMVENTIDLAESYLDSDDSQKVVIMCTFDEELNAIKQHFGDKAVVYNGKLSLKKKDNAQFKFKNDPNIKVFIGNIKAAGVGLNLEVANVLIFNSICFVSGENKQAEDRIFRLTQQKDCTVIYQMFNNSFSQEMFDFVLSKQMNIDKIIKKEDEK